MSSFNYYYGGVGSRKSAELILSYHRNKIIAGKSCLVLQSSINTRDGGKIRSRALKDTIPAIVVEKDMDIKRLYKGEDIIFIDELQFFEKHHIDELVDLMLKNEIIIFAYGLLSDFRAKLFDTIAYSIPYFTKIIEIKTVCECCGSRKATMNMMVGNHKSENGISVGNHFKSVCLRCYMKNKEKDNENKD